jgi:uncharacterized protein
MGDIVEFDITRLNNNIDKVIPIDETYSFTKEEMSGTDLIKLDDVKIVGELFKNSLGNIEINLDVDGIMVLPCAITLNPVDYPFHIEISGEIDELLQELEENSTNFKNSLDILPIIWENILMEIPMRVVSDEAKNISLSGDGWTFTTDEEEKASPLIGLMDYIDDSEVK